MYQVPRGLTTPVVSCPSRILGRRRSGFLDRVRRCAYHAFMQTTPSGSGPREGSSTNPRDVPLRSRPVVFGEVLFDVFSDRAVLGGASFNVAWNLSGLGLAPLLVSRVGDDEEGKEVLEAMRRWGMETSGVQVDSSRGTGVVEVRLERGEPSFDILPDRAYDFIDSRAALDCVRSWTDGNETLLYHGTLALRSEVSRSALEALRGLGLPVFLDVNLRDPWWERESVRDALRRATWVKLNEGELRLLVDADPEGDDEIERAAGGLREALDVALLIVTRGADGALVLRPHGELIDCQPPPLEDVMDTVGAGDAFSAVMILGLAKGWPVSFSLRRAVEFAAAVCKLRGAVSEDLGFYRRFAEKWAQEKAEGPVRGGG